MLAPAVPAQVETGPERFATLSVDWRAGRGEDSVVHEELPSSGTLIKANQLLRRHGQERCKLNAPVRIFQRGASLRLALTGQAGGLSLEFGHSLALDMGAKECFTSNSETEGGRKPTRQVGG